MCNHISYHMIKTLKLSMQSKFKKFKLRVTPPAHPLAALAPQCGLAPLGPNNWPTWPQLDSQNKTKMGKTSNPKSIICLMPLGIDFKMDFCGFGVPK